MEDSQEEMKYTLVSDAGLQELELTGKPTVLIVDDEELMREVTQLIVEEHGAETLLAGDGEEAVKVFEENIDAVKFVFLDFSMPKMNGYEAYVKIKELNPDVGVVFASGLKMTKEVEELRNNNEIEFISKPFHEVELIKALVALQKRMQPKA